jgi:hypothetical protein
MTGLDAFSPSEIAWLVETRGVAKANASLVTTLVLGILAGASIALGAVLSTTIAADSSLGYDKDFRTHQRSGPFFVAGGVRGARLESCLSDDCDVSQFIQSI